MSKNWKLGRASEREREMKVRNNEMVTKRKILLILELLELLNLLAATLSWVLHRPSLIAG